MTAAASDCALAGMLDPRTIPTGSATGGSIDDGRRKVLRASVVCTARPVIASEEKPR